MLTCKYILAALLMPCTALATAVQSDVGTVSDTAARADTVPTGTDACHADLRGLTLKTNVLMAGIGATNILDTYLSAEKYRGTDIRFLSLTRRERDASPWTNQFQHEGNVAYADNRSGNGGTLTGAYTFRYSLLHKWNVSLWHHPLQINGGGTIAANAGFIYNTRNGNNPANARLSLHIEPTIGFDYPLGHAGRRHGISFHPGHDARFPLILHYEASAPLAGLMFSPNYGQSYYEIFNRGNYDHNCVPTTFVSTPSLRQLLAIDFRIARTVVRIGYLGTVEQTRVNNLKTHVYTHSLMIGIVKRFRTVKQ